MKRTIVTIALILFSLFLRAQDKDSVVVLPTHIADSVILDLEYKDYLKIELDKRDSTIRVYEQDLTERYSLIKTLQLSVDEYKVLVTKLEDNEEIYERKQDNNKHKISNLQKRVFGLATLSVIELILLTLLLL